MEKVKTESFVLCPKFEKSFSILGKKWNGLIIDVLLERGPQRFGELKEKIPMLSDRVLVERLKELEAEGIITKAVPNRKMRRLAISNGTNSTLGRKMGKRRRMQLTASKTSCKLNVIK